MTRNPKDSRDSLDQLAAAMIESILEASDEEIAAELVEMGLSPTSEVAASRTALENAFQEHGRECLRRARAALDSERSAAVRSPPNIGTDEARQKLRSLLLREASHSELSIAARNESDLSDNDVLGILADIDELQHRRSKKASEF